MSANSPLRSIFHHKQQGLTIIELMIASTLSLLIVLGVTGLYLASSSSERTNAATSEILTNGRYAMEVLRRDLMHAGYRGHTWAKNSVPTTALGLITNDCSDGFAVDLDGAIFGSDDTNPYVGTCIRAASYATGDILVVRHAGLTPLSGAPQAKGMYLRSAYERGEVFRGDQVNAVAPRFADAAPVTDYPLEAKVYFISPFTSDASETPRIPALKRIRLAPPDPVIDPAMTQEVVASNIENIQLQYGRLKTDGTTQFYDANSISAAGIASEWENVVAVRVWLLVRASVPEPGYTNNTVYVLGNQTITPADGFRREVFSTVVQLRNH
ncbi:MAG: PilW family protein [Pseudomonadota bacterium]